jgi:FixJ family two-component response regulator
MDQRFRYEPTVSVVDDDADLLASLVEVVESMGVASEGWSSAAELMAEFDPSGHGCLLLDVRMPGIDGLQLQEKLVREGCKQPIVFITGHGDISMCKQAMRLGAVDFLEKPYRVPDLIDALKNALTLDRKQHEGAGDRQVVNDRIARLALDEQIVARFLAFGMTNLEIAEEMDVSKRTV